MISVREIDPADLALFDEWYDALRAGAVAGRTAALVVGREALGFSLRNPGTLKRRLAGGAFEDDRVLGAMVFLAVMPWSRQWFPAWIVVVILAREFLVTGLRGYVESLGRQFPADWLGKVKMFTQCGAVGIVVGLHAFEFSQPTYAFWRTVGFVFVYATLVTTIGSCAAYLIKTRQLLLESAR